MKRILKIVSTGFVFLALFISCMEKQDFDQYDDLSLTPTYEASILYVEAPEGDINTNSGVNFISQDFNFDAFAEDVFSDRVLDGLIIYEIANTTSKQLNITVEFLDENGNILDTENLAIDPAPTAILHREISYGGSGRPIDIIRNTSAIRLSATNLGDNTSTSNLPDPVVTFKSSGRFRIRIK